MVPVGSIGVDTNLQATGSDISSCQKRCRATAGCEAVYWHKSDLHCHILTGTFSHDQFTSVLASNTAYDSCFFDPDSSATEDAVWKALFQFV